MDLFHVLNRGVDKRIIFMDNRDRARFVHDLYEFNDEAPAGNAYRNFPMMDIVSPSWKPQESENTHKKRPLVDIHGWCLMPNHYHLLISERREGGLSDFIRKLNVGYAKYFNERHERAGTLFQGRTKKIPIQKEAHFLYILHYIHLNVLDLHKDTHEWRSGKISSVKNALKHLDSYRWSSFFDFCGNQNFSSILSKGVFADVFPDYRKAVARYLQDMDGTTAEYELE